jgi:A/G-specific adenine glycosylase
LHEAAKAIVKEHAGKVPSSRSELVELPGVGAYTASAVRTFAWNDPDIFIETNIRTVFIHFFFPHSKKIFDAHILPYLEKTLDRKNPREWYFALMDYGAHLKKTEGNASRRSAHHSKQKPFKGSDREVRGAILKALSHASTTMAAKTAIFKRAHSKTGYCACKRRLGFCERKKNLFASLARVGHAEDKR